ncbi:MAG: tetratricopeptide repeat protein [Leptolyngbyaceae cyanobacterium SM2_5_2]|nr:tetratricopeptide repeat protein [Leptolyngbyaceae cyanobacterium SM2_5_2]
MKSQHYLLPLLGLCLAMAGTPWAAQAQTPSEPSVPVEAAPVESETPAEAEPEATGPSASEAFTLGVERYNQEDYIGALEAFNLAIEQNPDLASAYLYRGMIFAQQEDYDLALADLNRAIELDPAMPTPTLLAALFSTNRAIRSKPRQTSTPPWPMIQMRPMPTCIEG